MMKIEITKSTPYHSEYTLTRADNSVEHIRLDTKTYFLHDICHFVVEKNLRYKNGFWGMLSQGFGFDELFGKANPDTEELRFIEQIVGPVQSVYSGYIARKDFQQSVQYLNFTASPGFLDTCLTEITTILQQWSQLPVEETLMLQWKDTNLSE